MRKPLKLPSPSPQYQSQTDEHADAPKCTLSPAAKGIIAEIVTLS